MSGWSHTSKSTLEQAQDCLIENGFITECSTTDKSNFGNQKKMLTKSGDRIELVSDRGQTFLHFQAGSLEFPVIGHEALALIGGTFEGKSADEIAAESAIRAQEIFTFLNCRPAKMLTEDLKLIRQSRARSIFGKISTEDSGK